MTYEDVTPEAQTIENIYTRFAKQLFGVILI